MGDHVTIDLKKLQGKFLSGRERGRDLRIAENIDNYDLTNKSVEVIFPDNVETISSSFFLGMFGRSILKYAEKDKFKSVYTFKGQAKALRNFDTYIDFALQNKNLIL